ncbi:FadR/GntR family transcriptional regulator [soil metagenome]
MAASLAKRSQAAVAPLAKPSPAARTASKQAALDVFRPVRVEPAYKAVSAEIERNILNGAIRPGEPLPTEQELSERFCVHRSTVREAIRQVEQEGLVQRREGRRLFVCLPGLFELAPRAARMLLLQQTTFQELWEVAVTLEPLAARLAALQAQPADLAQIDANIEATAVLTKEGAASEADNAALVDLDVEFHALVGRASHNRALMLAREPVSLLYKPTLFQLHVLLPQSKARNLAAHRNIAKALHARNADAAAEWTRKHMVDFQRGFAIAGLSMSSALTPPG